MWCALICGLAMTGQASADLNRLVEQLGAARYNEREQATRTLEAAGRDALPALRQGRNSEDPEVRQRVAALIGKIEADRMVKPSTVRLDFRNQPLPEVIAAISERSGIALQLVPDNPGVWQSRRITLEAPEAVPFWSVLDQLCKTAQLRHNLGAGNTFDSRGPMVQLYAGAPTGGAATSDRGPFRSLVTGIHYQRDRNFGPERARNIAPAIVIGPGGRPALNGGGGEAGEPTEQFYFDLQVLAEPRMVIAQSGPPRLTEAVDDRNQSLLPSAEGGNPLRGGNSIRSSGYFGMSGASAVQAQVPMSYPAQPGKVIKRLRGTVPVSLAARKEDPLVIALDQAKGKTFQTEEAALTIHGVEMAPNNQPGTSIEISLRPNAASDPNLDGGLVNAQMMAMRTQQAPQNQIEILDAQGRPYRQWYPSSSRIDQDEARMTLTLMPSDGLGPPAELRYYSMTRATTEVEFDFRNVPMP